MFKFDLRINIQDNLKMNLIVACDKHNGIGKNGYIPWYIKEDMEYFKKITKYSIVIMGRKTWESIPEQHRPLSDRANVIVSSTLSDTIDNVKVVKNIDELENYLNSRNKAIKQFIIGGQSLYSYALTKKINNIYVTKIFEEFDCDTYFPKFEVWKHYYLLSSCEPKQSYEYNGKTISYQFRKYSPYQSPLPYTTPYQQQGEYAYLDILNKVIDYGENRIDRTGIGTRSIFGTQLSFNIGDCFPLLTTKKMFLRGIIEELLWFLRGETDAKILKNKNVHIWDGNSSREFLDQIGLTEREEGDCGPIYGFNFRHYGAQYQHSKKDYSGLGTDQLKYVIDLIQNNPSSRRILINLWNPTQLNEVALPPCHVLYQFNVSSDEKYLSCSMYQRSGDLGLGVPFNIASATLLTYILAKMTNKIPKKLVLTIGEAHIYNNHIDTLKEQIKRTPYPFPKLNLNKKVNLNSINTLQYKDFELMGYEHHPALKMKMSV